MYMYTYTYTYKKYEAARTPAAAPTAVPKALPGTAGKCRHSQISIGCVCGNTS